MTLKSIAMILTLLTLPWSVAALEPISIGSGPGDEVINLDAGVKQPHQNYNFGRSGFVTPKMPQPMVLSPNMMINQAKGIRDEVLTIKDETMIAKSEVIAVRDEAKAEHNAAQTLMTQIAEKESRINDLQASAQSSAQASSSSAAKAEELYAKTEEAYGRALGLSMEAEEKLNQMDALVSKAEFFANESAHSVANIKDYYMGILEINDSIVAAYNGALVIDKNVSEVYSNVTLLANEVKGNANSVRAWVNQRAP